MARNSTDISVCGPSPLAVARNLRDFTQKGVASVRDLCGARDTENARINLTLDDFGCS